MERENSKFKEASEEIDSLVKSVNNLSAILPILIILVKIAVLYFANSLVEGIGDIIELIITSIFGGFIVRCFYELNKFHDQYSKSSCETLVIPEQLRNTYDDSVVKDAEANLDYIGSVKLLLDHGFKELIGQLFSTIIAVVGLWIPDSLSGNRSKLNLILFYFAITLPIFGIVSSFLKKIISRTLEVSDFAKVGFCFFISGVATIGLFVFEFVFFLNDEVWWKAFISVYFVVMVVIGISSLFANKHINKVEELKCKAKGANKRLS